MIRICDPDIGPEEQAAVARVLASGQIAQGPEVQAFEAEIASDLAGTDHAIAVSSGTAALELALEALDIGPEDVVLTTPFTFAATANAVLRTGARVRFCDIRDDFTIDPAAAAAASDGATLVLPVHLYGLPADMTALADLRLPLVEDAAQAHLASYGGRLVGGIGVAGCFSFYATKNMTTGEGGAVTTNDAALAQRIRILRNQGMTDRYAYVEPGTNRRMTDVAAAIGRVQLRRLPERTGRRRHVGQLLGEALADVGGIRLPSVPHGRTHVWHQYTLLLPRDVDRDKVVVRLAERGAEAGVYYPQLLCDYPAYRDHPRVDASAPLQEARNIAGRVLSLPVHPNVNDAQVERIAAAFREAIA